jgi:hypothetical protein
MTKEEDRGQKSRSQKEEVRNELTPANGGFLEEKPDGKRQRVPHFYLLPSDFCPLPSSFVTDSRVP